MNSFSHYDMAVIGSGPAGQKAAVQGAKAGKRVIVIEREPGVGGGCVYRGTIPSKTLRESALHMARAKHSSAMPELKLTADVPIASLMQRVDEVVTAHGAYMAQQLKRNGISCFHGRAQFRSDSVIEVLSVDGERQAISADRIILATGSRPRTPPEIPIDHEHILDSDSILSMIYLPRSLTILGGGVIASEYASIFAQLGVQATIVDRAERPLQFLDEELVNTFVRSFEQQGGRYVGGQIIDEVRWDGTSQVSTTLRNGQAIKSEKMLVAVGRQSNVEDLNLEAAGLTVNDKGTLPINEHYQTLSPYLRSRGSHRSTRLSLDRNGTGSQSRMPRTAPGVVPRFMNCSRPDFRYQGRITENGGRPIR